MLSLTGGTPAHTEPRPNQNRPEPAIDAPQACGMDSDSCNGLTRVQIVDRILAMNPSATADFLDRFDAQSLGDYLDHLTAATQPRGRSARWIRPSGARGISWSVRRN